MVHVCFPLHDETGSYSKYEGVAICSLLENTNSQVTIHIIHDETVSNDNINKFQKMIETYGQKLKLYRIGRSEFENLEHIYKFYSVGTLFRLMIPNVLPSELNKVIYLDADLVFNLDISELWNIDLENNVVAGRLDTSSSRMASVVCKKGMVSCEEYFNAGVMILNLKKLRSEYNLLEDCIEFLIANPEVTFCDQDAMNVLFKGKIKYLDEKYNMFTIPLRKTTYDNQLKAIYHFAGDYVHVENLEEFDYLFLLYFSRTPWWDYCDNARLIKLLSRKKQEQEKVLHLLMESVSKEKKIIIFGAGSVLVKHLQKVLSLNKYIDYFIDNNSLQSDNIDGIVIYHPNKIQTEEIGTFLLIVLSNKYYDKIKTQLEGYGLLEYRDFVDGRIMIDDALRLPIKL